MLSFFPRDVLDEIWDLVESVSEGLPTYSYRKMDTSFTVAPKYLLSPDSETEMRSSTRLY